MSTPAYVLAAWDFEPTREEGCAFAIYPETTSEPLAYVVKREGAEEIARLMAQSPKLRTLLAKARHHLPIAAASWNEEPQYAYHVQAVLALINEIDAELATPAVTAPEELAGAAA